MPPQETELASRAEHQSSIAPSGNRHVEEAYARWAPIYDLAFAFVMRPGRKALAAATSQLAGDAPRVLDVGVGTGLELPMFAPTLRLIGVDLSMPMLRRARQRVGMARLHNVDGLLVMDAMRLAFPDGSFDAVVAPYVLTVVPDPQACLDEWLRVLKPGGEIILVNHFGAEKGLVARGEVWLGRYSATLGWAPQFPFAVLADWLAGQPRAKLVERRALPPLGLFTLARVQKN